MTRLTLTYAKLAYYISEGGTHAIPNILGIEVVPESEEAKDLFERPRPFGFIQANFDEVDPDGKPADDALWKYEGELDAERMIVSIAWSDFFLLMSETAKVAETMPDWCGTVPEALGGGGNYEVATILRQMWQVINKAVSGGPFPETTHQEEIVVEICGKDGTHRINLADLLALAAQSGS